MALSIRQLTRAYELRYQNTAHVPHRNFSEGMIRDVASWELPEGACYDASDMLCDLVGKIRKRGGTTSPAAGNSTATVENLIAYKSGGADGVTGIFGSLGKAGTSIQLFSTSTGATTSVFSDGSADTYACRPFQHYNVMVFPFQAKGVTTNDRNRLIIGGGGTQTVGSTVVGFTVTAGDNRVTGLTGAGLTSAALGSLIAFTNGGVTQTYYGRIVEVTSATAVRVEPTPVNGFSAAAFQVASAINTGLVSTDDQVTGRYGVSFQGRMVLGYTLRTTAFTTANYAKGLDYKPNRIVWNQSDSEAPIQPGVTVDGLPYFASCPFNTYNYLDIPALGGMTGLAAIGDGQLVVFGPNSMYRVSGQLVTETVANNAFSFSVDRISANVGIPARTTYGIDDPSKSIQYTQGGLIFAGPGNIYQYDGSSLKPLLAGRNARYYQARLRAGDAIYGSAYSLVTNHYYLSMSGSDGGLLINLDTLALTRITNVTLFDAVPDPANASKLWGARWWDRTGVAPTLTKGQLIQIDPVWAPTSANKTDADGTSVLPVIQTKSYMDGDLEAQKLYTQVHIDYDLRGSGSPTATVTADTKLNTADASFAALTQGTLANTGTSAGVAHLDVTNQLAEGKALELKITTTACDSFELNGINIGMQQRALT